MRQALVVIGVLALAAGLAGCGGGKSPKATYEKMWEAAETGDRELCLSYFTRDSQAKILELDKLAGSLAPDRATEARLLDQYMAKAKTSILELGEQKISGETAKLIVTIDGKTEPTDFRREDGAWKIDVSAKLEPVIKALGGFKRLKDWGDRLKAKKKR